MTTKLIDTPENVKNLIVKIKALINKSIGAVKMAWIEFLNDCEAWLKANDIATFEVGRSYKFGFIGDSGLSAHITVTKKTKCFIHFTYWGRPKRAKINIYNGSEFVYPLGIYAKAPVCKASKLLTE